MTSSCFRGVYTYLISSVNEHDGAMTGFVGFNSMGKANRVRVMETIDDMRDLREWATCHHSELPDTFPISDGGFEKEYTFRIAGSAQ